MVLTLKETFISPSIYKNKNVFRFGFGICSSPDYVHNSYSFNRNPISSTKVSYLNCIQNDIFQNLFLFINSTFLKLETQNINVRSNTKTV